MLRFACLALLLTGQVTLASELSFMPLPDLPGGIARAFIAALSADGAVAVGQSDGPGELSYPFRWTREGGISALSESPGVANGVSAEGSVVVGSLINLPGPGSQAFRWTSSALIRLEGLDQTTQGIAWSVSGDGEAAVGESRGKAVLWAGEDSARELLGAGNNSRAVASSRDGSVVAGFTFGGEAFRWTEIGGAIPLGTLPGDDSSFARDMTPDGRIIVGVRAQLTPAPANGFRWTAETGMTEIGILPQAIADDGRIIVGDSLSGQPAIWMDVGGVVELQPFLSSLGLDLTGWTLTQVTAISGDGTTIAGQGICSHYVGGLDRSDPRAANLDAGRVNLGRSGAGLVSSGTKGGTKGRNKGGGTKGTFYFSLSLSGA